MSERALGPIHWLYGLSDYLEYAEEHNAKKLVDFIIKLSYADDPIFRLRETGSIHEFVFWLNKFTEDVEILTLIQKYVRDGYDTNVLPDLFSRGQVQSKIWLGTELAKIKQHYSMIYVYAGWFGQLLKYFEISGITYDKARIFDLDHNACLVSDKLFNFDKIQNWQVKSICTDLNNIVWNSQGAIYNPTGDIQEQTMPDLIINTSAEHMTDDWFFRIKFKEFVPAPMIVIQTNNLHELEEHINCVYSVDHMKKKYPMSEIYFEGELQLKEYKRFMLIGRP